MTIAVSVLALPFGIIGIDRSISREIQRRELVDDGELITSAFDLDDQIIAGPAPAREFQIIWRDARQECESVSFGFRERIIVFLHCVDLENQPDAALVEYRVVAISTSEHIKIAARAAGQKVISRAAIQHIGSGVRISISWPAIAVIFKDDIIARCCRQQRRK